MRADLGTNIALLRQERVAAERALDRATKAETALRETLQVLRENKQTSAVALREARRLQNAAAAQADKTAAALREALHDRQQADLANAAALESAQTALHEALRDRQQADEANAAELDKATKALHEALHDRQLADAANVTALDRATLALHEALHDRQLADATNASELARATLALQEALNDRQQADAANAAELARATLALHEALQDRQQADAANAAALENAQLITNDAIKRTGKLQATLNDAIVNHKRMIEIQDAAISRAHLENHEVLARAEKAELELATVSHEVAHVSNILSSTRDELTGVQADRAELEAELHQRGVESAAMAQMLAETEERLQAAEATLGYRMSRTIGRWLGSKPATVPTAAIESEDVAEPQLLAEPDSHEPELQSEILAEPELQPELAAVSELPAETEVALQNEPVAEAPAQRRVPLAVAIVAAAPVAAYRAVRQIGRWLDGKRPPAEAEADIGGQSTGAPSDEDLLNEKVAYVSAHALFDAEWYLDQYPDVAEAQLDPAYHYVTNGAAEGRNPGPAFDTEAYFDRHPEARFNGENPLIHADEAERRRIDAAVEAIREHPSFDAGWYLARYGDVAAADVDPALHYLQHGAREGRDPGPNFSTVGYWDENPEKSGENPLIHASGDEGRVENSDVIAAALRGSSFFDPAWYLAQNVDVLESGMDPVLHYIAYGAAERRDPGPMFSTGDYLDNYEDVRRSRMNPLWHYIGFGAAEGRLIAASLTATQKEQASAIARHPLSRSGRTPPVTGSPRNIISSRARMSRSTRAWASTSAGIFASIPTSTPRNGRPSCIM